MAFLSAIKHRYTPLFQTKTTSTESRSTNLPWISLCAVVALIAFLAGRSSQVSTAKSPAEPILASSSRIFEYQRLFGERPSPESDHAWLHLFPEWGGFFTHPDLAPQRSAFSVFHQLHCLDGIRKAYWTLHDIATSDKQLDESELPMMASPPHIRHCIDLLRQALMCQPDLTIEVKDEAIGGVRGFGTQHVCYDWDQLVDWTREWQDVDSPEAKGHTNSGAHVHNHEN